MEAHVGMGGRLLVGLGFLLHLLLLPIVFASGLVVPWPVMAVFLVGWIAAFALAVAKRDRPWLVVAIPLLSLAVLVAVVTLGEWLFGWTA